MDSAGVAVALADRVIRVALSANHRLPVGQLGCVLAGDGDGGGFGLVEATRLDVDGHFVGHSQRMLAGPMPDAGQDQRDCQRARGIGDLRCGPHPVRSGPARV